MNCCLKNIFLLIILCVQLLFSDPILAAKFQRNIENGSLSLDDKTDQQSLLFVDELFAGGKADGTPDGNDLILHGNGEINLTLTHGELQFEVCDRCRGKSSVCFDTTENNIHSKATCSGFPSYCKFEVKYKKDEEDGTESISFNDIPVNKNSFGNGCLQPLMKRIEAAIGQITFKSCEPKTDDKTIKLYINIDPSCSIRVLNAKVHVLEIPSTPAPSIPNRSSNTTDPSWTASFPWW
uniref:Uncharacterized protein n=1 Tax=Panagrolaimus sp. ES5 TaxID=591445 RepID=A0AC34G2H8_9BILA